MNERSRNFVTGLTTAAGLAGLVFLLLLFGYVPKFLQQGYFITIALSDAASLNPGSRVQLDGIDIGSVESISFAQPVGSGVEVRARIKEDVRIPADANAVVEKPLLGGSPTIRFTRKDRAQPPEAFLKNDGSEVVEGSEGALAGVFGEIENLSDSFDALSAQWQGVGEKLNVILAPQDLAAVERGDMPGNATTVLARVDQRLAELKTVIAGANELINDGEFRENLTTTAANLRSASGQVSENLAGLQKRYVALADDMAGVLAEAQKTLEIFNSGEGTAGKLANDPALYNSLDDTAKRIGSVADELKLLIDKWKDEGIAVKL